MLCIKRERRTVCCCKQTRWWGERGTLLSYLPVSKSSVVVRQVENPLTSPGISPRARYRLSYCMKISFVNINDLFFIHINKYQVAPSNRKCAKLLDERNPQTRIYINLFTPKEKNSNEKLVRSVKEIRAIGRVCTSLNIFGNKKVVQWSDFSVCDLLYYYNVKVLFVMLALEF